MARPNMKPVSTPGAAAPVGFEYDVGLEAVTGAGAEMVNPAPPPDFIQCTNNGQWIEFIDSLDDAYRFLRGVSVPTYMLPADAGAPAPDAEGPVCHSGRMLANADAAENLSRLAFTDVFRWRLDDVAGGFKDITWKWGTSIEGPKLNYDHNNHIMRFNVPGDPGGFIEVPDVPEAQMMTVVTRYDGATVYLEVYDQDGITLIGAADLDVVSLDSVDNEIRLPANYAMMKRVAYLNEFVPLGARMTDLLIRMAANNVDPLPVAAA